MRNSQITLATLKMFSQHKLEAESTIENISSLNTCGNYRNFETCQIVKKTVVSAVIQPQIDGNTDSQEEILDENNECIMPLSKNTEEQNELNLVENNQKQTTATIRTTHTPQRKNEKEA